MIDIDQNPDRIFTNSFIDRLPELNHSDSADSHRRMTQKFAVRISIIESLKEAIEMGFAFVFGFIIVRYILATNSAWSIVQVLYV